MDSGVFNAASYHAQTVDQASRVSEKFIKDMECEGENFMTCLQSKNATDILMKTITYTETWWMPVPDYSYKRGPFFPDDPLNLLSTVSPEIEVMIGTTRDEGIIYLAGERIKSFINIKSQLKIVFFRRTPRRELGGVQEQLQHLWH